MASEVDISNMALAHLGDRANVTSIDPPEGSPQAAHCARFYAQCVAEVQEKHNWGFCKRRIALAQVDNPSSTWAYAYAKPDLCCTIISILDPEAADDYSASAASQASDGSGLVLGVNAGVYTPQAFDVETSDDGSEIILTNQALAVCRYTVYVTDTSKFPALFVSAVSRLLASYLAGPVLKGDDGRKEAMAQLKIAEALIGQAAASDAMDRQVRPTHQVPWLAARG